MVVDGASSTDEGRDFIFQAEVGTDNELLQLADRHFELVIFRQQQGTTAKSTDWGEDYPTQVYRLEHEYSYSSTSRRLRGGCDRPASARDSVD